jgi:pimeloyl-ACP methyl ester carboxylesterase
LAEAYLKANPDPAGLQRMFDRDVARMKAFKDIPGEDIRGIVAPALVINGDNEVILAEHALALFRTLPNARLAILPAGHGEYIGEICSPDKNGPVPALVAAMVGEFLGVK